MVVLTVLLAGCSFDLEQGNAPRAALFGIALLATAAARRRFRGEFEIERQLPRCGTVGVPVHYTVRIKNLSAFAKDPLWIIEETSDSRLGFEDFKARLLPIRRTRHLRMAPGSPWGRLAEFRSTPLPPVTPGGQCVARLELLPIRRGILRLEAIAIARSEGLGLFRSLTRIAAAETLVILPQQYVVPNFELPGNPRWESGGTSLSHRAGDSVEFLGIRDYRPGDPLRRIHWSSWARTGKPATREWEDEFVTHHALVLDTFTEPDNFEVFEEAVRVAASFATQTRSEESRLDLLIAGDRIHRVIASLHHEGQLLEVLASVRIETQKDFATLRNLVLELGGEFTGVLCIFVKWDDERRELVRQIAQRSIPIHVFVVLAQGSDRQDFSDEPALPRECFHVLRTGRIQEDLQSLNSRSASPQ